MKRFATLMMVVFLFVAALPTNAQLVTNCYGLDADDCAIVTNSTLATASLTGLSMEFEFDVAVTGLALVSAFDPSSEVEDIFVNVVGVGDIDLSQDTPALAFALAVTNEAEGETIEIGLTIVDGVLYLETPDGVVALNLDAETLAELGLPADFLSNSPSTFGELLDAEAATEVATPEDLSAIEAYITYGRDEDNADGDAVFAFHLDITALLNSPEVTQVLGQLGGFAGEDEDAQMVLMLLPMLISMVESEVGFAQSINDDGYVTSFEVAFYLGADLGAFLAPEAGLDPVEVSANVYFDFYNFDAPDEIVAPEGATFLTAEQVQQLLGSFAP